MYTTSHGMEVDIGNSGMKLFHEDRSDSEDGNVGWAGTALVNVPQIRHLYVEKCAWGISISTWLIWLVAGALLLSYCIFRNDTLFTFVQIINITAIVAKSFSPAEEIGFACTT